MFFRFCLLLIVFLPFSPLTAEESIAEDIAVSDFVFRVKLMGIPIVDLLVSVLFLISVISILFALRLHLPWGLLKNPVLILIVFAAIVGLIHTIVVHTSLKNTLYDLKVVMYYFAGLLLGYYTLVQAIRRGKPFFDALVQLSLLLVVFDSLGRLCQFIIYFFNDKLLVMIALAGFPVVSPFTEPYNALVFLPVSPILFVASVVFVLSGSALSLSLGTALPFLVVLAVRPWKSILALRLLLPLLLSLNIIQVFAMQQAYNFCTESDSDYSGASAICLKTTGIETRIKQFEALVNYQNSHWLTPLIGVGLGQTYVDENEYRDDPFAQGTSVSEFGEFTERKFIVHTSLANQLLKFGALPIMLTFYFVDKIICRIALFSRTRLSVAELSILSLLLLWYTNPVFYYGGPKAALFSGLASSFLYLFFLSKRYDLVNRLAV